MSETKQFLLQQLRDDYMGFMQKLVAMPGASVQKQQAFLRFDEGHMWMQSAVMNYMEPQPIEPPVPLDQEPPIEIVVPIEEPESNMECAPVVDINPIPVEQ